MNCRKAFLSAAENPTRTLTRRRNPGESLKHLIVTLFFLKFDLELVEVGLGIVNG